MKPALLSLFLLAAAAGAQEPVETFYETATVQARPLSSATGSVTVIDREAIEASGARTVGDLLRLTPGVSVTTNSRGGLGVAHIRAGEPNFTLVLLDGVPLNDPTYQMGDVFDLEGLPAAGIERIEIVRGPLSSFYGSTGLAGVVQIFTRDGGEPAAPAITVELAAGNASFRRGTGTLSGESWSVTALWEEEAERIAEERFEQAGGLASLALGRLRLKARGTRWEGDDYPDASGGPVYGDGELRRSEHEELSLAAGLSFGARHRQYRLEASVYRHALDRRSPAVFPVVPDSVEETRFTRTRVGWASVLRESDALRWSAGMDVQREQGENESLLAGGFLSGDYDITRTLPGAYTELIAGRGGWTFELGSRIDLPEDHAAQWSPRLGIARQLGKARLRASAGRAWKLPSFFVLASPPELGGNPDLRPETVLGGDLGIEWRLASLTVFYNRYENLIDFDFESFTHLNRSQVETRGVEGAWSWKPREGVSLRGNITWQELDSEVDLRHRPEWTGGLQARWQPVPALTLDLDAQAVSRFFDQQIPVETRRTVDGYELLGLGAAWRFSESFARGWELRLRVDNLLDEGYETLIGFPGPERSLRAGLRWSAR